MTETDNRPFTGKTFSVIIQGCRTNQYEGEALAAAFEAGGGVYSEKDADIYVVVSCTITAGADRKFRKLVRRIRRENPLSVIAVCGCLAENIPGDESKKLGIDILAGNRLKYKLPSMTAEFISSGGKAPLRSFADDISRDKTWDALALDRPRLHTRAFLKVQDGCNHCCSYCIVPYVRGFPVSRDVDESVKEAEMIISSGCPEIILTGVHIGLHKQLPLLVRRIGAIKGLKRLRFGSIEPFAISGELLAVMADTKAFCPHLHLPLQSGDDTVLASMRRGYTSSAFAKAVEKARAFLGGDLHISTDIIVGFPGEGEKEFQNSMNFTREIGFGKIHVFPYSARPGTPAAKLGQIPADAVKARTGEALALAGALHEKYCRRWINKDVEVLVEENKNGTTDGLTPHYVRVKTRSGASPTAEISARPLYFKGGVLWSFIPPEQAALSDRE